MKYNNLNEKNLLYNLLWKYLKWNRPQLKQWRNKEVAKTVSANYKFFGSSILFMVRDAIV